MHCSPSATEAATIKERATYMAKFVQATTDEGAKVHINLDTVTHIIDPTDADDLTTIVLLGDDTLQVKETAKQLLDRSAGAY
jgi:hypothetical protein